MNKQIWSHKVVSGQKVGIFHKTDDKEAVCGCVRACVRACVCVCVCVFWRPSQWVLLTQKCRSPLLRTHRYQTFSLLRDDIPLESNFKKIFFRPSQPVRIQQADAERTVTAGWDGTSSFLRPVNQQAEAELFFFNAQSTSTVIAGWSGTGFFYFIFLRPVNQYGYRRLRRNVFLLFVFYAQSTSTVIADWGGTVFFFTPSQPVRL